jgi:hypothetical protein
MNKIRGGRKMFINWANASHLLSPFFGVTILVWICLQAEQTPPHQRIKIGTVKCKNFAFLEKMYFRVSRPLNGCNIEFSDIL